MILPVRCGLSRYQSVLWSIEVAVGDRPRTLLVDLGAGITCLSRGLVAELDLALRSTCTGARMNGEPLEIALHAGVALGFGEVEIVLERVGVLDVEALLPPSWPPVDGVLALDAFRRSPFTLDLGTDELILETPTSLADRMADGRPVAIRCYEQIAGVSLVLLAAVESVEGRLWFELDNSNTGPVIVSPRGATALGLGTKTKHAFAIDGLGRVQSELVVKDIIYDGNLGRSVLDGRRLTVDLHRESVIAR